MPTRSGLPPIYCYYGDDFTGSTDVLDCLARSGVTAVLFPGIPSPEQVARFSNCQVLGIAGSSRSQSPEWMDAHLPQIFALLKSLGAPLTHYKVCSTFDSSPQRGSIGRAMEIGRRIFRAPFVPIMVGAPHLGRYVAFGNLFATAGGEVYRIDRHPTMRAHPATPMTEADLRLHLAQQTDLDIALIDLRALGAGDADAALQFRMNGGAEAIVLDGVDMASVKEAGRLIWQQALQQPIFAVGSSGLTSSLIPQWREAGLLAESDATRDDAGKQPGAVDAILVVSGSCSPVTAGQIQWAIQHGFTAMKLDAATLADSVKGPLALQAHAHTVVEQLRQGRSVVLYSAMGPLEAEAEVYGEEFGTALSALLRDVLRASRVRRLVIAGGDTSSHTVARLGLDALTWAGAVEPGAPLCRVHASEDFLDGTEIVLKGGQVGSEDFFERVRRGGASA
ncbi:MAG: four-carbon acid sugar kinase family protein [Acidobacteriaceae bacterium]